MPNYLHRTTKQYLQSVSPASLSEPAANYIFMPDLSAVVGVPVIYWVITGDVVSEMSQAEKDAVDAARLSNSRDSAIQEQIDNQEAVLRQLAKMMVSELNILRQQINTTTAESIDLTNTALADRTIAQVKNQLRSDLGS